MSTLFLTQAETAQILTTTISSNSIATVEQITEIHNALAEASKTETAPEGAAKQIATALAFACADQGSSQYVIPVGNSSGITLALAATIVRKTCTLRQFCMFYAKVVYNTMKRTNRAPSNWAKKGYTNDTRFAAFDFFSGAFSDLVMAPFEMKFSPTDEEIRMHNENAFVLINSSRQAASTSTLGAISSAQQVSAQKSHLSFGNLN